MESNKISTEYMYNELYKGNSNFALSLASLMSFYGGRHIISDFYDHRQDILCNPFVKVLILFSVLYMNIKSLKISILLFFVYLFFIDNYVESHCNKDY